MYYGNTQYISAEKWKREVLGRTFHQLSSYRTLNRIENDDFNNSYLPRECFYKVIALQR
jgi:hypothetical protein